MSDSNHPRSANDRNVSGPLPAGDVRRGEFETRATLQTVIALEGVLGKIGQDCRQEPLEYLASSQAWQQGE